MAIAGDVVIKLAADVADLKTGLADAIGKLDEFGKSTKSIGDNMTAAATKGSVFGNLITKGIDRAVAEFDKLWEASKQAALQAEKTAAALGVTSEQAQALAKVAAETGLSLNDLAKYGKANAEWLEKVTYEAKQAGQVMSSEYSKEVKRASDATEELNRKLAVLFAPLVAGVSSFITDGLDRIITDLAVIASKEGVLDKLMALARMLGYGGSKGAGQQFGIDEYNRLVDDAKKAMDEAQQRATPVGNYGVPAIVKQRAEEAKKAYEDALIVRGQYLDAQRKAGYGPSAIPIPTITPAPTGGGGGGGRTDDDLMEAQIKRYEALAAAAQKTGDVIANYHGQNVDDLERELRVQQAIDDITAKLGAKYKDAGEEKQKQLKAAVEADLLQREANARAQQYAKQAEDIELRLGEATAQRMRTLRELLRLQAAGLQGPALERYRKQQEESNRLQELNAKRYSDDIGSIGAGFEASMEQWSRAHDLFSSGSAAFAATADALGQAFETLAGRSNKSFEQIAADFANMLSKIALQMAISEAFKWLLKIAGTALSASTATPTSPDAAMQAYNSAGDWYTRPGFVGRAGGGDVYPGNAYRVGEYGPETFVPTAVGRIEPYSANGGGNVTVNVDMKKAEGARDPSAALEFGRRVKAAVRVVIENEKRPGGTLYGGAAA